MLKFKQFNRDILISICAIFMLNCPATANHKIHHYHERYYYDKRQYHHNSMRQLRRVHRKKYIHDKSHIKAIKHNPARIYEFIHRNHRYNYNKFLRVPYNNTLLPINRLVIHFVEHQLNSQSLYNINHDRVLNHSRKLRWDKKLSKLALIRSEQSQRDFAHLDKYGIPYVADDASKVDINKHIAEDDISENLISAPLGESVQDDDPTDYYSKNGRDLADEDENSMMNYDNDNNGHRLNILDNTSRHVGIASSYDYSNNNFYLAEEFE